MCVCNERCFLKKSRPNSLLRANISMNKHQKQNFCFDLLKELEKCCGKYVRICEIYISWLSVILLSYYRTFQSPPLHIYSVYGWMHNQFIHYFINLLFCIMRKIHRIVFLLSTNFCFTFSKLCVVLIFSVPMGNPMSVMLMDSVL